MQKKLLLMNGSHSDIPLINAAHELGYYVITIGNKPELIGHKYADEYHNIDFSDYEAVYEFAKTLDLSAVCSCANDFGEITASYVGEKLGFKGHDSFETTLLLHHKNKFKEFAKKNNILTPLADSFSDIEQAISSVGKIEYPVIIKPIDLTGGKGINRANNEKECIECIKTAFEKSPSKNIVIEKFIVGTQHSFSTFIVDKKVIAHYSDNEYSYLNPYFVSTSAGPADRIKDYEYILIEQVEKIAQLMNLVDGIFHVQYLLQEDGSPFIIECTRRCSGDLYSYPVEHALGIPWSKWMVSAECGLSCKDFSPCIAMQTYGGRHCIMGNKNEIVKDVVISDELKGNIYDSLLWWKPGDKISNYLVDKLGILMLEYKSREEMLDKTNRITDLVKVIYE